MIAALDGAAIVMVPSASPVRGVTGEGEVDSNGRHWENYNRTMARNFGLFVVHANRVGVEDGQTFWGGSEIIGPDGETLAKAAYFEPDFVSATLPLEAMRRRRIQAPVMRDENVDLTINELCRVRGRIAPPVREARRDDRRDDRRGDRRDDRRDDRRGHRNDRHGHHRR
jgi:predicted amidohydrolase